jgi:hypothetical protein
MYHVLKLGEAGRFAAMLCGSSWQQFTAMGTVSQRSGRGDLAWWSESAHTYSAAWPPVPHCQVLRMSCPRNLMQFGNVRRHQAKYRCGDGCVLSAAHQESGGRSHRVCKNKQTILEAAVLQYCALTQLGTKSHNRKAMGCLHTIALDCSYVPVRKADPLP